MSAEDVLDSKFDHPLPLAVRVFRGAAWSTGASVITLPIALATTVVLARTLGPAGFGELALYTFLTALILGLSDVGIGEALLQRGSTATGRGETAALLRSVQAGTTFALIRLPVVTIAGFLILPAAWPAAIFGLSMALLLTFTGPGLYLVATSDVAYASRVRLLGAVLSATAGIITGIGTRDPATTFAAISLATSLVTALLVLGVPAPLRTACLKPGRLDLTRSDLSFGIGNFVNAQLNQFVFGRSELLFFPASAAVGRGTFAAAQTIAARSTLLLDAAFGALPSAMANAAGQGPQALHRAFLRMSQSMRALLALAGPVLAVLVVTLAPVVFGAGFEDVAVLALTLTVISLWQTGSLPINLLWYATRQVRPLLICGLVAGVVDLALSATLIPQYGARGAVVASSVTGVVYILSSTVMVIIRREWRRATITHSAHVLLIVLTSAACGGAVYLIPVGTTLAVLGGVAVAVLASAALVMLPGLRPHPRDLAAIRSILERSSITSCSRSKRTDQG